MKSMKKKGGMKKAKKSTMKRRKAMKVSKIAKGKRAKSSVFRGTKIKTSGGLVKTDLIKSKTGKIVSKKASARGKLTYKKNGLAKWIAACQKARKDLRLKGFVAIGDHRNRGAFFCFEYLLDKGKSPQGKALLAKARSYFK